MNNKMNELMSQMSNRNANINALKLRIRDTKTLLNDIETNEEVAKIYEENKSYVEYKKESLKDYEEELAMLMAEQRKDTAAYMMYLCV